jgi:hypothetical protein
MKTRPHKCSIMLAVIFCGLAPAGISLGVDAQTAPPKPPTGASASPQRSAPPVVPAALQEIEANAEGIFDVAPKDDWPAITQHTAAIAKVWPAYRLQAATDRVPQQSQDALAAALQRLQKAERARDKIGALRASNDLMFVVFDIYEVYHPAVPADLGRGVAQGQQLIINLLADDPGAAGKSLAQTRLIWARLKPAVLAKQGAAAAAKYDASLRVQTDALVAKDLVRLKAGAQQGLDIVDVMEKLF